MLNYCKRSCNVCRGKSFLAFQNGIQIIQIVIHIECVCHVQGLLTCKLNGNCTCKENVVGNTCANCKVNYYGFPDCTGKFYSFH